MESNISNIYTASLFNNLYLYRTLRWQHSRMLLRSSGADPTV